jgi:hypothetical protein
MHRSTRQTVRRMQRLIESAHGQLLGVVATGVTRGPGYEHYYPSSYAQAGSHPRTGWRRFAPGRRRARQAEPVPVANLTQIRADAGREGTESRASLP